jgi:AcrR family transcriptional regulator
MSECVRGRQGRVVGRRGVESRDRLLDALSALVGKVGWRHMAPIDVAREAALSPGNFYVYFKELKDAVIALAVCLDTAGEAFLEHLRMILGLLEFEGWKLPEFSNNSTIEEW